MWFYSGNGDEGKSSLMDGNRMYKNEPEFELLGTLDELSANLGLAISFCPEGQFQQDLSISQKYISDVMGLIASGNNPAQVTEILTWIEDRVQVYGNQNQNPKQFVPAGKTNVGAAMDIARTVARRAERRAVDFWLKNPGGMDEKILAVLNRFSSLFFLMRLSIDNR